MKALTGSQSVQAPRESPNVRFAMDIRDAIASLRRDRSAVDLAIVAFERLASLRATRPARLVKVISINRERQETVSTTTAA